MTISYEWPGEFTSAEANALHAKCFATRCWATTRGTGWGRSKGAQPGVGVRARRGREDHLRGFYFDACGFTPTDAGLIEL